VLFDHLRPLCYANCKNCIVWVGHINHIHSVLMGYVANYFSRLG
jgi:hypothetical protein